MIDCGALFNARFSFSGWETGFRPAQPLYLAVSDQAKPLNEGLQGPAHSFTPLKPGVNESRRTGEQKLRCDRKFDPSALKNVLRPGRGSTTKN
jgi:hypothetical protein